MSRVKNGAGTKLVAIGGSYPVGRGVRVSVESVDMPMGGRPAAVRMKVETKREDISISRSDGPAEVNELFCVFAGFPWRIRVGEKREVPLAVTPVTDGVEFRVRAG